MNELTILKVVPGKIQTNFVDFKKQLAESLESYKTMNVTEENLKSRKVDRKILTDSRKAIDKARKETKSIFLAPLTTYEEECKEAIAMISEAEQFLKDQTDRFDEEVRQSKRDHAKATKIAKLATLEVPLFDKYISRIDLNVDWYTNVATSLKKIKEDVESQIDTLVKNQSTEESNKLHVLNQLTSVSELTDLSTPLTLDDIRHLTYDYETMDITSVSEQIASLAKTRKEAEVAAIKRAEERRIAEAKAKEEAEAKAIRDEEARIERERLQKIEVERLAKIEAETVKEAIEDVVEEPKESFIPTMDFFEEPEEVKPVTYLHQVTITTTDPSMIVYNKISELGYTVTVKGSVEI